MEIKLNIPKKGNKKEIEKTYTADLVDIPFGIIINLSKAIDFDNLKDVDTTQLGLTLVKSIQEVETLFLYIFDGYKLLSTIFRNITSLLTVYNFDNFLHISSASRCRKYRPFRINR